MAANEKHARKIAAEKGIAVSARKLFGDNFEIQVGHLFVTRRNSSGNSCWYIAADPQPQPIQYGHVGETILRAVDIIERERVARTIWNTYNAAVLMGGKIADIAGAAMDNVGDTSSVNQNSDVEVTECWVSSVEGLLTAEGADAVSDDVLAWFKDHGIVG